ncbi:DMT family transporter [soil metagenome]
MNRENRGLLLGFIGVTIFAMTLPMTRLAVGPETAPQLSPTFITSGRASCAALFSALYLLYARAALPQWRHLPYFVLTAAGTAIGYPFFLGLALRHVESMHAAVVSGLMPIATAACAALWFRQRASIGFWSCALIGCGLVIAFALYNGAGRFSIADGYLLLAILSTAIGYVAGAQASREVPSEQVICWALILILPFTLPVAWWTRPTHAVESSAWLAFAYVTLFSMWLGSIVWYRGLASGGTMRVSQVQLLQPFLSLIFAVPVLGEPFDPATVVFSMAIVAVVFVGKRMQIN